jgi:hypothetical protein
MRPSLTLVLNTDNRYYCKLYYGKKMIAKMNDGIEDVRISYKGKRMIVSLDLTNIDLVTEDSKSLEFAVQSVSETINPPQPTKPAEPGLRVDEKRSKDERRKGKRTRGSGSDHRS